VQQTLPEHRSLGRQPAGPPFRPISRAPAVVDGQERLLL